MAWWEGGHDRTCSSVVVAAPSAITHASASIVIGVAVCWSAISSGGRPSCRSTGCAVRKLKPNEMSPPKTAPRLKMTQKTCMVKRSENGDLGGL